MKAPYVSSGAPAESEAAAAAKGQLFIVEHAGGFSKGG
jgi:hypothetical protein